MTEIRKTIAHNLRTVCKVKHVKNVDIAEYMGVSPSSVSNWFKGTNFLDVDNLFKLCQYLGVSMDQIFGIEPILFETMNAEENQLLDAYRKADCITRNHVLKLLDLDPVFEKEKGTAG